MSETIKEQSEVALTHKHAVQSTNMQCSPQKFSILESLRATSPQIGPASLLMPQVIAASNSLVI